MGDPVVPIVPGGGNPNSPPGTVTEKKKQPSPYKYFVFTLENYAIADITNLKRSSSSIVPQLGFQEEDTNEFGEPTTPHLQGFGVFKTKKRPIGYFKKVMGHTKMHFEKMKGTVIDNVVYCTSEFRKDGVTRKRKIGGDVYKRGLPRPVVKMTYEHLTDDQKDIVDKYREFEDPLFGREIHWYWEPDGEWGKTKTQKYMFDNMGATGVGGHKKDMFYALSELQKKHGEVPPIVIINLVKDTDMQYVSYAGMESIKDGWFFSPKFESGMCRFNSPHLLVFANAEPDMSRFTKGRQQHRCVVTRLEHPEEL